MRVGLGISLVARALFVFAMVRVIAFGTEATERDREPLNTVATPDFCPRYEPTVLPPELPLRRRETRNLGNGTLGRSYTYGDGARAVELHVGFEALDIYDATSTSPSTKSSSAASRAPCTYRGRSTAVSSA